MHIISSQRDSAKTNLKGAYQKAQDIWEGMNETGDQEPSANLDNSTYAQVMQILASKFQINLLPLMNQNYLLKLDLN